ncbi:hypothetical protein NDN08_002253 [Rhodosorus marinus]|uniref:Strictosidine synthase conserved region domain-containing protein n=1 Tax=Rhodosorus marinus TaxID=101924 RepID=A0AAV8UTA4_9RHOD|nr:hypothetical protein NDN08_002253 [Rhodosorus marinus]
MVLLDGVQNGISLKQALAINADRTPTWAFESCRRCSGYQSVIGEMKTVKKAVLLLLLATVTAHEVPSLVPVDGGSLLVGDFIPEGIVDVEGGFILSSVADPGLPVFVNRHTGEAKTIDLEEDTEDDVFSTLGLDTAHKGTVLLAVNLEVFPTFESQLAGEPLPENLRDGRVAIINLQKKTARSVVLENSISPNDIAYHEGEGSAYVTDTFARKVYKIDDILSRRPQISIFASGPLLEVDVFGPNGVVYSKSTGALISVTDGAASRIVVARPLKFGLAPLMYQTRFLSMELDPITEFDADLVGNGFDGVLFGYTDEGEEDLKQLYVISAQLVLRLYSTDKFATARVIQSWEVPTSECMQMTTAVLRRATLNIVCSQGFGPGPYPIKRIHVAPLWYLLGEVDPFAAVCQ